MINKKNGPKKSTDESRDRPEGESSVDNNDFGAEEDHHPKGVSETIKKVISASIGTAFMTEESIRSYLSDIKLPKEVLNLLLQNASKSKEEFLNRVSHEVVRIIEKINFVEEASRFVEGHKFRINAEVEVIKKEKPAE